MRKHPNSLLFCQASTSGIQTLVFSSSSSSVPLSTPKISMFTLAILGQPFRISCYSERGSLPINYTLLKGSYPVGVATVSHSSAPALFTVTVSKSEEIKMFRCTAKNSKKKREERSEYLNATVIGEYSALNCPHQHCFMNLD